MIADKLLQYISTCPHLKENAFFTADFLAEEQNNYSIESTATEKVLVEYIDGTMEKQKIFYLTSRESAGAYSDINLENQTLYEKIANWIESNNRAGILPLLEYPYQAEEIKVLTDSYVSQVDADRARYEMKLKLTYLEFKKELNNNNNNNDSENENENVEGV